MIYNGFDFEPWMDTRLITRTFMPSMKVTTQEVPYRQGERFANARFEPLSIIVRARWKASVGDDMAALRRVMVEKLACFEEAPLYVDDDRHLGIWYKAVLVNPGELDTLWYTGAAEFEFTAYDPIGYGEKRKATIGYNSNAWAGGSYEAWPVFTCTPGGNVSYLKLTNMDTGDYVQITRSLTSSSEVVIDMGNCKVLVDGASVAPDFESIFFPLKPGANNLRLSSGSGTAEWTDRYIG